MSSAEHLELFIRGRLSDAAEEIWAAFHKVFLEYEEELQHFRKCFARPRNPVVLLRRIGQWRFTFRYFFRLFWRKPPQQKMGHVGYIVKFF